MKWNLTKIYKTKEDFNNDLIYVRESILKFSKYQNHLGEKDILVEFLEFQDVVELKLSKLFTYAHMAFDLNQKNMETLQDYQIVYSVYNDLMQASSFVSSELISVGKEKLVQFINEDSNLEKYRFMLEKLFNKKD